MAEIEYLLQQLPASIVLQKNSLGQHTDLRPPQRLIFVNLFAHESNNPTAKLPRRDNTHYIVVRDLLPHFSHDLNKTLITLHINEVNVMKDMKNA